MTIPSRVPFLNCGKIRKVKLPAKLTKHDKAINLAEVSVNLRKAKAPCILLNYSQILEFNIFDSNPLLKIVYRLVCQSHTTGRSRILEEWTFKAAEVVPTNVQQNINTIEPLVLNYCDCLDDRCEQSFTYIVQLAEIDSNNTTFRITTQDISAIVSRGEAE